MKSLSSRIRSISIEYGADLVGFAPVERFEIGPKETRPEHYLSSARSVVSIAIAYPQSISKIWGTYKEEGTLPGAYMWY